jgi:gag-polypeptide of LTR copia-type
MGKLMSLNEEARLFRMKPGEKPSVYVMRARKIANTLNSLGRDPDDLATCMMILNGLTPEYDELKQISLYSQ